ncbi:MAG: VOC family protein [Candidatus Binatia bacterium]
MALAKKIDHVTVVVKDMEAAVSTFRNNFSFPVGLAGAAPELNMRFTCLRIGDALLEILQPTNDKNAGMQFLAERGEGMYALSLEVESLDRVVESLAKKGISTRVRSFREGSRLCFIGPEHTHGVVLQLIEYTKPQ